MQPYRKYNNKKVEIDNIKFDSKLESNIYLRLKELNIPYTLQPRYVLMDKFRLNNKAYREIDYVGDFEIQINDKLYTLDAKGLETQVFKIKAKLFALRYGKEIICIKSVKQFNEWIKGVGEWN